MLKQGEFRVVREPNTVALVYRPRGRVQVMHLPDVQAKALSHALDMIADAKPDAPGTMHVPLDGDISGRCSFAGKPRKHRKAAKRKVA
jgi:hypothetical protein